MKNERKVDTYVPPRTNVTAYESVMGGVQEQLDFISENRKKKEATIE